MQDMITFIKENVLGRVLLTDELTYRLDEDALEGVYSDQIVFTNLYESAYGFGFDMHIAASETVYNLDENGMRGSVRKVFDGNSLFRYELAQRRSSGDVTGMTRLISTTNREQTAQAIVTGIYDMELADGALRWKELQLLYRDQPAASGYRSVAFDAECRFFLEGGRLSFEYSGACFDVDPVTLEKKASHDVFPSFIAQER